MQGETKKHVDALMPQLGEAQVLFEEKESLEREATNEIASLTQANDEEHDLRVTLEESVLNLEVSHNLNIFKLTKERDHALAMVNVLKNERIEFDVGHAKVLKDSGILDS
jgi:ABC-type Mn2+/Zn2+ transport system ATPase subunit